MMVMYFPWAFTFCSMWSQGSKVWYTTPLDSKFHVSGVLFRFQEVSQREGSIVPAYFLGLVVDMTVVFFVRMCSWRVVIGLVDESPVVCDKQHII